MKRAILSFSLLLVIVAALQSLNTSAGWDPAGEKLYELKYQMAEGTRFVMSSTGTMESVTDQMGTEVTAEITSEGEDTYSVQSSDKEKGLTIELVMGTRTQDVYSDQGSASTDFSELTGKKVRFVLSFGGDVSGHEGFDALPEITAVTGEVLTPELYRLGVQETFTELPDKPVKIGDTWSEVEGNDIPLGGGTLRSESDFTYTVMEETEKDGFDCLRIEFTGTENLTGDFEQAGTLLSIERETKAKGVLYFAYKKGMFISAEVESRGEGSILVQDAGIELPQTLTSKGAVSVRFLQ